MAYGLYLVMDQPKWYRDDFSSENKLTGTIYTNQQYTKKKNLTGYTLKIRLYKNYRWGDYFGKTATISSATGGTFEYAVNENEMPPPNIYNIKLELSKTGVQESTLNRQELLILEGPSS